MILAVLGLVAAVARADEIEVTLQNGSTLKGEVVEVTEKGIRLKVKGEELYLEAKHVEPISMYNAAMRVLPNVDAQTHIEVALWCFENGLFTRSHHHYKRALLLDPKRVESFEKQELPKLQEKIAGTMLANARRALEHGDVRHAERLTASILTELNETKTADEARKFILEIYHSDKDQSWRNVSDKPEPAPDAADERARAKALAPIENRVRQAREHNLRGLRTKGTSKKKKSFSIAAKRAESALRSLDKLAAKHPDWKKQIDDLRKVAQQEGVDAYLNTASLYLIRRSFPRAIDAVQRAQAIDPESEEIKRMRLRIEQDSQRRTQPGWY
ncbi:MAG: hypothetical protein AAGD14_03015 [Planctomycetota bacterium]